jgi:hypothetical protein
MKRTTTTKDIALLHQLQKEGQLDLQPDFQRNSVWPSAAKAYLIDTIANDRPIPVLYFQRLTSAQTGRPGYAVIDGQQRLRAVFDFLDDKFALTESKAKALKGKRYSQLAAEYKGRILQYDFTVEELTGYTVEDIRDMFLRMNRFVVKLSPQEIRHARSTGKFRDLVEQLGSLDFWSDYRVFTEHQIKRFRPVEFAAELVILLVEGIQDKKAAVDLYYTAYQDRLPFGKAISRRLGDYLEWITVAIPDLDQSRFRKPVDMYTLIAALDEVTDESSLLGHLDPEEAGEALLKFEKQLTSANPAGEASRYLLAASQQTDNLRPRETRADIVAELLRRAFA